MEMQEDWTHWIKFCKCSALLTNVPTHDSRVWNSGQLLWLTCCWCLELASSWLPRMLLSPFPGNRWAAWKNWKSTSPQWELPWCVTQWCFSCSVFSKHRPSEFRESEANTSKSDLPWGPWEYASDPPTTDSWVLQGLWNPLLCLCSGCFPRCSCLGLEMLRSYGFLWWATLSHGLTDALVKFSFDLMADHSRSLYIASSSFPLHLIRLSSCSNGLSVFPSSFLILLDWHLPNKSLGHLISTCHLLLRKPRLTHLPIASSCFPPGIQRERSSCCSRIPWEPAQDSEHQGGCLERRGCRVESVGDSGPPQDGEWNKPTSERREKCRNWRRTESSW